eukprot:7550852-Alexandrium_andersonii.AAC.1
MDARIHGRAGAFARDCGAGAGTFKHADTAKATVLPAQRATQMCTTQPAARRMLIMQHCAAVRVQ